MKEKKYKIYLFYVSNNPLWRHFPNSLLALCNPLTDAGLTPVIIDTVLQKTEILALDDALFAGFSIYTDINITRALALARDLRARYPTLPLVWGGPHVIMKPEQAARHPLVDVACYGEGEISVAALARNLLNGKETFENVPGIIWKNAAGELVKNPAPDYVDVNALAVYPYQILDEKLYNLKHGKIYYEASRGCPYGCKFCSYDHTKWRNRAADKVIEDLGFIEREFMPQEIQITDANHFMSIPWVSRIWAGKISRGLKFRWETNCRFDTLARIPDEVLAIIAASGCYQLRLGAESGSQEILDYLNKGVKVEELFVGLEKCRRHNIAPLISFMVGYPPEGEREIDATTQLIDRIRVKFPAAQINGLFQFQPYPNTKIYEEISRDYHIPQPETLDGWAQYQIIEMHRGDFPWLSNRQYRQLRVLNAIVSYIFFADKVRNMPREQRNAIAFFKFVPLFYLFLACDSVVRNIFVRLRWDRKIMFFPFEWYVWNFIRKNVLKLF
ncbi:MAG: radical SAM protein [Candidatus Omnitrophota bacterium]